jgi:RNA polymerase sigma-70 factor (sigma-E family)
MDGRDPEAFTNFAKARSRALHRMAYLMVGDTQFAQDLVQEALTKTYMAWPRLHSHDHAEAYTRKAITTTAISWFRRKGWKGERVTANPPERPGHEHAEAVEQQLWLRSALAELPPRQRAAITLRYFADLSEADTAAAMNCAVGTVKSQVSAGLRKLRQHLDPHRQHSIAELSDNLMVVNS